MQLNIESKIRLNNGIEMPLLGLGSWQLARGKEARNAVMHALKIGYRLIDTAKLYANEKDVGLAVKESGIPRGDVFVTTKLWNSDHGYKAAMDAFDKSMRNLDLGYIDLYLIHWPVPRLRGESWKALVELYEGGKCRAIGVSNYTISHLEELLANTAVAPAVNQVEFSPFLFQKELLHYCRKHSIQLEAYSPLTKGARLEDPALVLFAEKYRRTPAQILVRWALQHEVVVIPKSSRPERIEENSNVYDFEIQPSDMAALDSLNRDFRTTWDPTTMK